MGVLSFERTYPMAIQKKPVVRTSNIAGVVVKPNNHKNHPSDFHGIYTFVVSVSVVPEVADKSYVGIISAVATSHDEAKRSIENDLKEGFCEADSFVLRRFQPFGQDEVEEFGLFRGFTSVDEFFNTFKNRYRSNRPKTGAQPFMSGVYDIVDAAFSHCSIAA
jgi:hypothetical protein